MPEIRFRVRRLSIRRYIQKQIKKEQEYTHKALNNNISDADMSDSGEFNEENKKDKVS